MFEHTYKAIQRLSFAGYEVLPDGISLLTDLEAIAY